MSTIVEARHTPQDLLEMSDGSSYELVDGQLVEINMGQESGWIAGQIFRRLDSFQETNRTGWAFPAEIGYQCFPDDPDKVRRPDGSFIQMGRLPQEKLFKGHCRIAPDLAIEVVSPNDLFYDVMEKVEEYHSAGVAIVWVIDPKTRAVHVLRADGSVQKLHSDDQLSGGYVIPGFSCRVGDLFPPGE